MDDKMELTTFGQPKTTAVVEAGQNSIDTGTSDSNPESNLAAQSAVPAVVPPPPAISGFCNSLPHETVVEPSPPPATLTTFGQPQASAPVLEEAKPNTCITDLGTFESKPESNSEAPADAPVTEPPPSAEQKDCNSTQETAVVEPTTQVKMSTFGKVLTVEPSDNNKEAVIGGDQVITINNNKEDQTETGEAETRRLSSGTDPNQAGDQTKVSIFAEGDPTSVEAPDPDDPNDESPMPVVGLLDADRHSLGSGHNGRPYSSEMKLSFVDEEKGFNKARFVVLTTMAIATVVLILTSVGVIFLVTTAARSQDMGAYNSSKTVTIQGEVRLTDRMFVPAFDDHSSEEFKDFEAIFTKWADEKFQQSDYKDLYRTTKVLDIRNGSIIVDFIVVLKSTGEFPKWTGEGSDSQAYYQALREFLYNSLQSMQFASQPVKATVIKLNLVIGSTHVVFLNTGPPKMTPTTVGSTAEARTVGMTNQPSTSKAMTLQMTTKPMTTANINMLMSTSGQEPGSSGSIEPDLSSTSQPMQTQTAPMMTSSVLNTSTAPSGGTTRPSTSSMPTDSTITLTTISMTNTTGGRKKRSTLEVSPTQEPLTSGFGDIDYLLTNGLSTIFRPSDEQSADKSSTRQLLTSQSTTKVPSTGESTSQRFSSQMLTSKSSSTGMASTKGMADGRYTGQSLTSQPPTNMPSTDQSTTHSSTSQLSTRLLSSLMTSSQQDTNTMLTSPLVQTQPPRTLSPATRQSTDTSRLSTSHWSTGQFTAKSSTSQDSTSQLLTSQLLTSQRSTSMMPSTAQSTATGSTSQDSTSRSSTSQLSTSMMPSTAQSTDKSSTSQVSTNKLLTSQWATRMTTSTGQSTAKGSTSQDSTGQMSTGQLSTSKMPSTAHVTARGSTSQESTSHLQTSQTTSTGQSTAKGSTSQHSTSQLSTISPDGSHTTLLTRSEPSRSGTPPHETSPLTDRTTGQITETTKVSTNIPGSPTPELTDDVIEGCFVNPLHECVTSGWSMGTTRTPNYFGLGNNTSQILHLYLSLTQTIDLTTEDGRFVQRVLCNLLAPSCDDRPIGGALPCASACLEAQRLLGDAESSPLRALCNNALPESASDDICFKAQQNSIPDPSLDLCANYVCNYGGTCFTLNHEAYCRCSTGYGGKHCEIDPCITNPCRNGGTCRGQVDLTVYYVCACDEGYHGDHCEITVDNPVPTRTQPPFWTSPIINGECQDSLPYTHYTAGTWSSDWRALAGPSKCNAHARLLFCFLSHPEAGDLMAESDLWRAPCRSLCEGVFNECDSLFYLSNWNGSLNCTVFPTTPTQTAGFCTI